MKKWAWLLVLPWVVKFSTCTLDGNPGENLWLNGYTHEVVSCNYSQRGKDAAEDLAAALNEQAKKRIKPSDQDFNRKGREEVEQMNKEACGQDDCGAEPK